jgi:hypothetical protein
MEPHIDLFKIALSLKNERSVSFICEGCHNRAIYKDAIGNLYLAKYINDEISLFPVKITDLIHTIEHRPL